MNKLTALKARVQFKYGTYMKLGAGFLVYALFVNALDELVIPLALAYFGHPVLGSIAFVGDLDWLTYPLYFVFADTIQKYIPFLAQ